MANLTEFDDWNARRPSWRRFCLMLALLAIGACSTAEKPSTPLGEPAATTARFSMAGRISVRIDNRVDSGGFRWRRGSDSELFSLHSPLGTQLAELSRSADGRAEFRKDGETISAPSIGALARELLGVSLDLDRVSAWLQGNELGADGKAALSDSAGRVWQVEASGFERRAPFRFARRLTLVSGDIVVKLVVDEWEPG